MGEIYAFPMHREVLRILSQGNFVVLDTGVFFPMFHEDKGREISRLDLSHAGFQFATTGNSDDRQQFLSQYLTDYWSGMEEILKHPKSVVVDEVLKETPHAARYVKGQITASLAMLKLDRIQRSFVSEFFEQWFDKAEKISNMYVDPKTLSFSHAEYRRLFADCEGKVSRTDIAVMNKALSLSSTYLQPVSLVTTDSDIDRTIRNVEDKCEEIASNSGFFAPNCRIYFTLSKYGKKRSPSLKIMYPDQNKKKNHIDFAIINFIYESLFPRTDDRPLDYLISMGKTHTEKECK